MSPCAGGDLPQVEKMIGALEVELLAIAEAAPREEPAEQPLIDPLTLRELEILQLIGAGYSNPDIAARCYLAVGTVKAHTSRIYSKLAVENRVQAVARARELSLLDAYDN